MIFGGEILRANTLHGDLLAGFPSLVQLRTSSLCQKDVFGWCAVRPKKEARQARWQTADLILARLGHWSRRLIAVPVSELRAELRRILQGRIP